VTAARIGHECIEGRPDEESGGGRAHRGTLSTRD